MTLISIYSAQATATGGRSGGRVSTADGAIDVRLELPLELGGEPGRSGDGAADKGALNPEQLFASAWAASIADAIGFVARQHNRILRQISVTVTVNLGQYENNGFGISAEFAFTLPELPRAEAENIIAEARATCPYCKSFRNTENTKTIIL